jgi:hypothetical protein
MLENPHSYNVSGRVVHQSDYAPLGDIYVWRNLLVIHGTTILGDDRTFPVAISFHLLDDLARTPFDILIPRGTIHESPEGMYAGSFPLKDFFCTFWLRRTPERNLFVKIYQQLDPSVSTLTLVQSHELPGLHLPTLSGASIYDTAILDNRIYFVPIDQATKQTHLEVYQFSFAADKTLQISIDKKLILEPRYTSSSANLRLNGSFLFFQNRSVLRKTVIDAYDLNEIRKGTSPLRPRHSFQHPYLADDPDWWQGGFGWLYAINEKRIAIAASEEPRSEEFNYRGVVYVFDCDPHSSQFGQLDLEVDSPMPRNVGYFGSRLFYFDDRLIVGQDGSDPPGAAAIFEIDNAGATVNTIDLKMPLGFRERVFPSAARHGRQVLVLGYLFDNVSNHRHAKILSLEDSPSFSGEHPTPKITEGLCGAPDGNELLSAAVSETKTMAPGGKVTWYAYGPAGKQFKFRLTRVPSSGGHLHDDGTEDPRAVGKAVPPEVTTTGSGSIPVEYQSTLMCGHVHMEMVEVSYPNDVKGTVYNIVTFSGLVALPSHKALRPYTFDPGHPDAHWGTQDLVNRIMRLADAFASAFPNQVLWVNDMSLREGGLLDSVQGARLAPPHKGHKYGGEVDISYLKMTPAHRKWFRENVEKTSNFFRRVKLHGSPIHWHCSIWSAIEVDPEA